MKYYQMLNCQPLSHAEQLEDFGTSLKFTSTESSSLGFNVEITQKLRYEHLLSEKLTKK